MSDEWRDFQPKFMDSTGAFTTGTGQYRVVGKCVEFRSVISPAVVFGRPLTVSLPTEDEVKND